MQLRSTHTYEHACVPPTNIAVVHRYPNILTSKVVKALLHILMWLWLRSRTSLTWSNAVRIVIQRNSP